MRSYRLPQLVSIAAVLLASALGSSSSVSAQYFGQNKVQYKNLDFKVLKTEHFDIYFYPSERPGIDIAARLSERWLARLERIFAHKLRGRQPLVLYASHTDFEQTNTIQGELGEGTGGVTEPLRRRIVLPFGGPLADTDHVIGHELVHAFQFDITSNPNAPPSQNGAERLPLWFIEGMAEYLSLGPVDPNTAMWLRDAARQEKLPTIDDLNSPKYFPYRWGQAFWAYVGGRWGDEVIHRMLAVAAAAGDVNVATKMILGVTTKELSKDWQEAIRKAYQPVLAQTTTPGEAGRLVIKASDVNNLNIGPAISPDGKWLALLSSRSLFSIDLYIADAANGRIVQKLTSTASDPHYSSIQFIYSAGAWDSSSQRIAIATVTAGHPALAVFNAQSGRKEREASIPDVDEIINPTWAPDGHAICFTGMKGGLTDLYIYDLNASALHRLTNDPYADLQPAWSPDGKRIAFVTDRFSSRLDSLSIGAYRLALIDPESGAIEQVRAFTSGKNINPQWSPDGRSLFFLSDRDGIANLYRVTLATGEVAQLTTVGTGLSGITSISPAMSVAAKSGLASFSVYEGGKYDIYTLDPAEKRGTVVSSPGGSTGTTAPGAAPTGTVPAGTAAASASSASLGTPAAMSAAALPPFDRRPSEVANLLANTSYGLPPAQDNQVVPYKPSLSLEAVGRPVVGVGASRFGTAVGGGASFFFSDMLGDHSLATAVQFNSGITGSFSPKDTAAEVAYFNQAKRWNWGLAGGQVPYLSLGFLPSQLQQRGSDITETDRLVFFRQTEQSVSALTAYPFNRAERVEFQAGVTRVGFDEIIRSTEYSVFTGQLYNDQTQEFSLARTLTLGTASAAYVHDTSVFGATSPVQGSRYRIEASPSFGSINYSGVLADYRQYIMPVPFYTLAARVMHYGRYGGGSDDSRLFPLFIGYPGLVRGYDLYSFDQTDCPVDPRNPTASCHAFDRLIGSRMVIANVEFRFPLLRPFGVSQRMYGPVPVEVALFADGGVTWNGLKAPSSPADATAGLTGFVTQPRSFRLKDGVSSAGVALRVNLFGFAVGEFDFARPFQRPGRGWVFQFNLTPGF